MKRIKSLAIGAFALAAMSFTAASVNPVEKAAMSLSQTALTTAVDQGYISASDKQAVLESGIIEAMTQTLIDTDYDFAAAVDKGAEVAVAKGWFKNKAAAKRALRKALEDARKSPTIANKVYNLLGL